MNTTAIVECITALTKCLAECLEEAAEQDRKIAELRENVRLAWREVSRLNAKEKKEEA